MAVISSPYKGSVFIWAFLVHVDSGRSASSLMTGSYPVSSSSLQSSQQDKSSKKPRTQFLPKQLYRLEEKFLENQFPNGKEREDISKELELTPHHIQVIIIIG